MTMFRNIQTIVVFIVLAGLRVFAYGQDAQIQGQVVETEQDLGLKVHHVIGNHDVFGVYPASGVGTADHGYGKQMFQERMGHTYYSFDHKGYHFIILDSIQITPDRSFQGWIDAVQISWLRKDLGSIPMGMPVIVASHVPLVTGCLSYEAPRAKLSQVFVGNAYEVLPAFDGHNVLAVLQGHLHVNEVITFKGIPYVTSGAVSGNWWHVTRLGTPEGFTVVSLHDGKISWRYETYGFKSVDPQST
jgi:Icc protein